MDGEIDIKSDGEIPADGATIERYAILIHDQKAALRNFCCPYSLKCDKHTF